MVGLNAINLFGQNKNIDCLYKFNGYDKSLQRERIETNSSVLIEYLGRKKSNQLNPNSIPDINVSMSKIGSSHLLHLEIYFNSIINTNNYIPEKAKLILRFITGEKIILLSINQAKKLKQTNGISKFLPIYHLPNDILDIIKNKDLNLITIAWSSGKQTYETYQLDVLRQLYSCIN